MAEAEWIKLYLKTFRTSRKISAIERMKNGDTIIVIWFKLLCLAGEINDDGMIYITQKKPFDSVSLADELKKPRAVVEAAIEVFEEHDMLIKDDAGFLQIINWGKYQNTDRLAELRAQDRERQRRRRERQKQSTQCDESRDRHVTVTPVVTECHDIEEEGEEDSEGEISFNHSIAREENSDISDKKESVRMEYLGGTLGKGVVLLSKEQLDCLLDELSLDEFNKYVGIVAECELNGQKYRKKTHFQAILDMVNKDRQIGTGK